MKILYNIYVVKQYGNNGKKNTAMRLLHHLAYKYKQKFCKSFNIILFTCKYFKLSKPDILEILFELNIRHSRNLCCTRSPISSIWLPLKSTMASIDPTAFCPSDHAELVEHLLGANVRHSFNWLFLFKDKTRGQLYLTLKSHYFYFDNMLPYWLSSEIYLALSCTRADKFPNGVKSSIKLSDKSMCIKFG